MTYVTGCFYEPLTMSDLQRACLECGDPLHSGSSARRRYCSDRCRNRAAQRRHRGDQSPAATPSASAASRGPSRAELKRLLHEERRRANRATQAVATAHVKQLQAEELADSLRTRLNLHEKRSRRAMVSMSNKLAALREQYPAGQRVQNGVQQGGQQGGQQGVHVSDQGGRPLSATGSDTGSDNAPDSPVSDRVDTDSATGSATGSATPAGASRVGRGAVLDRTVDTAIRQEVATLQQRVATVTGRYDQVVAQYRELFERYEALAGHYNRAAAALGEVSEERARVATIIHQWDQLCERLDTTTRGRRVATGDQIILDTWAAYREAAGQSGHSDSGHTSGQSGVQSGGQSSGHATGRSPAPTGDRSPGHRDPRPVSSAVTNDAPHDVTSGQEGLR